MPASWGLLGSQYLEVFLGATSKEQKPNEVPAQARLGSLASSPSSAYHAGKPSWEAVHPEERRCRQSRERRQEEDPHPEVASKGAGRRGLPSPELALFSLGVKLSSSVFFFPIPDC